MAKKTKSSTHLPIETDMVSDFVCPWCWLGLKLYLKGTNGSKPKPTLTFRPYMLDANIPAEGVDYRAYMTSKFGDKPSTQWTQMREHLETAGPEVGIHFDFKAITRRPNTLNAHRLQRWAQGQDVGMACAEALFRAFLEEGRDIGDIDVLTDIATTIGMDGDLTRELLERDDDAMDVRNEILFFKGLGISGVPTFIYAGKLAVTGAQDPDTHKKMLADAKKLPLEQD